MDTNTAGEQGVSQNVARNIPYNHESQNIARNIPYDHESQNITKNIPYDHVSQNVARSIPYDHESQNIARNIPYDYVSQNVARNIPYDDETQNIVRNIPYDHVSQNFARNTYDHAERYVAINTYDQAERNVARNIPYEHDVSQNTARNVPYDHVSQKDARNLPHDRSENRIMVGCEDNRDTYSACADARHHIPPAAVTHRWVRTTIPDVDMRAERETASQQFRDMASMVNQLASEVLQLKSNPTPPASAADNDSLSPLATDTVSLSPAVVAIPLSTTTGSAYW